MMNRQIKLSAFITVLLFLLISVPAFSASVQYTYDDLNRVARVEYNNGTAVEYTYGDAGSRLCKKVAIVNICEGDFDKDQDVDGSDLAVFAADFGRTDCTGDCEGDFDSDNDVDGSDLAVFAADFGRTDCP